MKTCCLCFNSILLNTAFLRSTYTLSYTGFYYLLSLITYCLVNKCLMNCKNNLFKINVLQIKTTYYSGFYLYEIHEISRQE